MRRKIITYALVLISVFVGIIILYIAVVERFVGEKPAHADYEIAYNVRTVIYSQDIPMIDFVYEVPGRNGVVHLYGTLQRHEDVMRIVRLVQNVSGVNKVISHIDIGNYQLMYEKKIRDYLYLPMEGGYARLKSWNIENKKQVYKHLSEYLFYRESLPSNVVADVEKLQELLECDIESATSTE